MTTQMLELIVAAIVLTMIPTFIYILVGGIWVKRWREIRNRSVRRDAE